MTMKDGLKFGIGFCAGKFVWTLITSATLRLIDKDAYDRVMHKHRPEKEVKTEE